MRVSTLKRLEIATTRIPTPEGACLGLVTTDRLLPLDAITPGPTLRVVAGQHRCHDSFRLTDFFLDRTVLASRPLMDAGWRNSVPLDFDYPHELIVPARGLRFRGFGRSETATGSMLRGARDRPRAA